MKNLIDNFINSSLFILSNTVIIVPYMLFINISTGRTISSILPFVLFYSFRMTSIFFIRGIKNSLTSENLLSISLLLGGVGSIFGVFGGLIPFFYILSGISLGISASWLPAANITINKFHKGNKPKTNYAVVLSLLIALGYTFIWKNPWAICGAFLLYGIIYCMGWIQLERYPKYTPSYQEENVLSRWELIVFILLFTFLFLLRSSRLIKDISDFDYALVGFSIFFVLAIVLTYRNSKTRRLSFSLNSISTINGVIGNYLFLFSSIYVTGMYGPKNIFLILYIPYVLGMIIGMLGAPKIYKKRPDLVHILGLVGIVIGLIVMSISHLTFESILIISSFKSFLNYWINQQFFELDNVSFDKRILLKYTNQNKGSIYHQFFYMLILYLLIYLKKDADKMILSIIGGSMVTGTARNILEMSKIISSLIILLLLLIYIFYLLNIKKKSSLSNDVGGEKS